jgi:hypothetical protein
MLKVSRKINNVSVKGEIQSYCMFFFVFLVADFGKITIFEFFFLHKHQSFRVYLKKTKIFSFQLYIENSLNYIPECKKKQWVLTKRRDENG